MHGLVLRAGIAALVLLMAGSACRPADSPRVDVGAADTVAVPATTTPPAIDDTGSWETAPLLGLLRLPTVFGADPCASHTARDVALYSAPGTTTPIGAIGVRRPASIDSAGGCTPQDVGYEIGTDSGFPTMREVSYEQMALEVIGTSPGGWYRVRLAEDGVAWIRANAAEDFAPVLELLRDGLTALSPDWDRRSASEAGGTLGAAPAPARANAPVKVLTSQEIAGRTWVQLAILSQSPCESGEPTVMQSLWVPLHDARGQPVVRFASRGC